MFPEVWCIPEGVQHSVMATVPQGVQEVESRREEGWREPGSRL